MTNLPLDTDGIQWPAPPSAAAIRAASARHVARLGCAPTVVYVCPDCADCDGGGLEVRTAGNLRRGTFWVGRPLAN